MSGHADVAAAGLHGVQGSGEGEREFVEMALEIAVAGEAEPPNDANNCRRVRLQALGHGAHAKEHVFARLFDGKRLLAMASSEEVGATLLVLFDPGFRKAAVADFRENLAHFLASLFRDDARPSGVVALLGSVADGIAHIAEAATVDQINDELEFVEALEIGDLGLVARFRERFESRFD